MEDNPYIVGDRVRLDSWFSGVVIGRTADGYRCLVEWDGWHNLVDHRYLAHDAEDHRPIHDVGTRQPPQPLLAARGWSETGMKHG